jgi:hypothetical protein
VTSLIGIFELGSGSTGHADELAGCGMAGATAGSWEIQRELVVVSAPDVLGELRGSLTAGGVGSGGVRLQAATDVTVAIETMKRVSERARPRRCAMASDSRTARR